MKPLQRGTAFSNFLGKLTSSFANKEADNLLSMQKYIMRTFRFGLSSSIALKKQVGSDEEKDSIVSNKREYDRAR